MGYFDMGLSSVSIERDHGLVVTESWDYESGDPCVMPIWQ